MRKEHDLVGLLEQKAPVAGGHNGAMMSLPNGCPQRCFGGPVYGARHVVKHPQLGRVQEHARKRDSLPLSSR